MLPLLILFVILLIFYVASYYKYVARFPKGPTPLPIIGNIHQLNAANVHESFADMTKIYGSVFTVFLPKPCVIITDYNLIKEAFQTKGDVYSGRTGKFPDTLFQTSEAHPNAGVIFSQGEIWKENRRVSLHILRDFGMGKNIMEEQVKCCFLEMDKYLRNLPDKNKGISLRMPIQTFVANVIYQTLFACQSPFSEDSLLMKFNVITSELFEEVRASSLALIAGTYTWIKHIPILGDYAYHRYFRKAQPFKDFCREQIKMTLQNYNADDEPQCFIQAFYQKMHNNEVIKHEFDQQALNVVSDFFLAGLETTSTTLRWAMNYVAAYPDVQAKCREEIISTIGADILPSLSDKQNLPYTNATVLEIQRCANIIPLNVLHRTTEDSELNGLKIPADTIVIGQIHTVMSSDAVFKNPEEFRPERYLMEDMKTLNKSVIERSIPFSIGKRQCAGEGLARVELFIGFAALLQRYKLSPMPGEKIDLSPTMGLVLQPQNCKLVVEDVNSNRM